MDPLCHFAVQERTRSSSAQAARKTCSTTATNGVTANWLATSLDFLSMQPIFFFTFSSRNFFIFLFIFCFNAILVVFYCCSLLLKVAQILQWFMLSFCLFACVLSYTTVNRHKTVYLIWSFAVQKFISSEKRCMTNFEVKQECALVLLNPFWRSVTVLLWGTLYMSGTFLMATNMLLVFCRIWILTAQHILSDCLFVLLFLCNLFLFNVSTVLCSVCTVCPASGAS